MGILDELFGQAGPAGAQDLPADAGSGGSFDTTDLVRKLRERAIAQYEDQPSGHAVPDGQWKITHPEDTADGRRVVTPATPRTAQPGQPTPPTQSPAQIPARPGPPVGPPAASPQPMQQPGYFDRFMSNFQRMQGMPDRYAQNATEQFLIKQGAPPESARAMVLNPTIMQQVAPSLLGSQTQFVNNMLIDKRTGKIIADFRDYATTHPVATFKNPATQEDVHATFEPSIQGHVAPNGDIYSGPMMGKNLIQLRQQGAVPAAAGAPQPQATPGVVAPAPAGIPGGASPAAPAQAPVGGPAAASFLNPQSVNEGIYTIPPAPSGADRAAFRTEATKKSAGEMMSDQQKGIGAIEFLSQADQARKMIQEKGDVIGRYATPGVEEGTASVGGGIPGEGSVHVPVSRGFASAPFATTLKFGRDVLGSMPTVQSVGKDLGLVGPDVEDRNLYAINNDKRDQLEQMFTKLAQSGLKATYGSRVTNIDVNQQQKTVPHLNDTSAKTSLDKLNTIEEQSWRTLNQQLKSGLLNPDAIPPAIAERAIASGKFSDDVAAKFPAAQSKQLLSTMPPEVGSVVEQNMRKAGIDPASPRGAQVLKAVVDEYRKGGSK